MHDTSLILHSTARLLVPLLLAALGELIAERSGAINISVEGMLLGSAFGAGAASDVTGSPAAGLLAGVAVGVLIASAQALLSHRLTVNQFVIGIALNILVLGVTGYVLDNYAINTTAMSTVNIPGLQSIPLVGPALFQEPLAFYLLFAILPLVYWLLWRSRWGLEIRACGDDPESSSMSGVRVNLRRRQAIYLCGALAGLGGAYLAVAAVGTVSANMTAGLGYIAIAAVIFGGWTIRGTVLGCLLFAGSDALRLALPAIGYHVNTELLVSAPYLLALAALVVLARRRSQPGALGVAFAEDD